MATVKKMRKAQEGAGVPKGKVQGEMTGKMYDKKPFIARKDSASADLQKAIGPKTKPLSSKEQAKEALKALANKKKMKDGGKSFPDLKKAKSGVSLSPSKQNVSNELGGYKKVIGKNYSGKAKDGKSVKKAMGGMKMMMSGGKCKYGC